MQKIFSQELRFKDENGNDYPDWEKKKLKEIACVYTGNTPSKKKIYIGIRVNTFGLHLLTLIIVKIFMKVKTN